MSRIRGKDTKPEVVIRSMLHRMGYRFRIHVKRLPGCSDIVLPKYRAVIFGQKNFKKPLNDMKSLPESWKGKDGRLWLYGSVKRPTQKKYTEKIGDVHEILAFSGQERAVSSEAFYPGFLSIVAIR